MMKLTCEQISTFREDGVIVVDHLFDDQDFVPIINEINAFVEERAQKLYADGKVQDLFAGASFETRLAKLFQQCPQIRDGFDLMHLRGKAMFEFLRHPKLLDAIESLLGAELVCSPIQHLRAKPPTNTDLPPNVNVVIPWHQDAGVAWEEIEQSKVVTAWIPLVDATIENGCLEVMPGAWRGGTLEHQFTGQTAIKAQCLPSVPPRQVPIPKGSAILMTMHTPHRSLPNRTDQIRWSLDLRYQRTGTPTGRPFLPAFVARSRQHPDSVLTDHARWCELWIDALAKSKGIKSQRPAFSN